MSTARRDLLGAFIATTYLFTACGPPASLFTVGGTVSGLTGTVELRLDDLEPYAVAMNGPFTFPAELEDGTSFTVAVSAQPAGQHCTVDGGSGIVAGADVTSVNVTCTTSLYTIGGTVSGLVGSLTLRDAQAGEIAVTEDGAFTLPNALPDGAAYDVQIATPEPLQRCAVSDASGSVDGADVSAVRIVCTDKTWHHPSSATDFVSPGTDDTVEYSLALDSEGNGYLVWLQGDGTSDCPGRNGARCALVYLREFDQGVPGELQQLNTELPRTARAGLSSTHVAVTDDGDVIVIWAQLDQTTDCAGSPCSRLFVAARRGGFWRLPTRFEDAISPPAGDADMSALAVAGENAVLAWRHDGRILIGEYEGGALTLPASVDDAISPEGVAPGAIGPDAAVDAAGHAIVVWTQRDPESCAGSGCNQIFFSDRRAGSWQHPASIADHVSFSGSAADNPQVAMHGGRALIVWQQSGILVSEHDGISWTHPASPDDVISLEGMSAQLPFATMSAAGAAVAWEDRPSDCLDPEPCSYTFVSEQTGEGWIHPADFSDAIAPPVASLGATRIAMDDRGRIVIAWRVVADVGNVFIQMADRRRGVWTRPASASDAISVRAQGSPVVAVSASGNAMIAWDGPTDSGRQIFVSHYD